MKPLIRRSDLSDPPRYYVLTRYRVDGNTVIASTKYDVTEQIEDLFPVREDEPTGIDRLRTLIEQEPQTLDISRQRMLALIEKASHGR